MRTVVSILAGLALLAAAPPPPGGASRPAYTAATCTPGFMPNPVTYPASAQDVKYQCFGTASCPPLFSVASPSKTTPNPLLFEYACSRTGTVLPAGNATCSAGFSPSIQGYPQGEKLVYFCDTKAVICATGFSVVDNSADSGILPGPKFFYACISSAPH